MSEVDSSAAVYQPGLWADALARGGPAAARQNKAEVRESYVYVVGPKASGKSTLINKVLRPNSDPKKGSDVVDFHCARKSNADGKTDLACIWEFPGTPELAQALATKDRTASSTPLPAFFLPAKAINTAVVVVVVDLSRPAEALEMCCTWIERVEAALGEQYKLLESRGSQLPSQLKARAARVAAAAGSGRQPGEGVRHTGIQLVICATKADTLRGVDAARKAVLARSLRCVAHVHGAHLLYTGGNGLQAGLSADDRAEVEGMNKRLRNLLTHAMFNGFDKKLPVDAFKGLSKGRQHPEVAPEGPLCVLHGTDTLADIRMPNGSAVVDAASAEAAWRAKVAADFSAEPGQPQAGLPNTAAFAADESIDALVAHMQDELKSMVDKERAALERQRILAKKRAAASGAGSTTKQGARARAKA